MRRWHEEMAVMLKRWRAELKRHGYRWGDYVGLSLGGAVVCVRSCPCEKGPGHYRKRRPFSHHDHCECCCYGKTIGMDKRGSFRPMREYEALRAERRADEDFPYRKVPRKLLPKRNVGHNISLPS